MENHRSPGGSPRRHLARCGTELSCLPAAQMTDMAGMDEDEEGSQVSSGGGWPQEGQWHDALQKWGRRNKQPQDPPGRPGISEVHYFCSEDNDVEMSSIGSKSQTQRTLSTWTWLVYLEAKTLAI